MYCAIAVVLILLLIFAHGYYENYTEMHEESSITPLLDLDAAYRSSRECMGAGPPRKVRNVKTARGDSKKNDEQMFDSVNNVIRAQAAPMWAQKTPPPSSHGKIYDREIIGVNGYIYKN